MPSAESPKTINSTAELAEYLNVSQWTVSRAINGHKDVSEKMRTRVFETMEKFSFEPDFYARGLSGRGTGLIGVSYSRHNIPIVEEKLIELQEVLGESGYRCIFQTTSNQLENELKTVKEFIRMRVEGIVIIQSQMTTNHSKNIFGKTPVVLVDPIREGFPYSTISLDRSKAMHMLFEHLVELGHKRIATFGFDALDGWRWPPLKQAAEKLGMDPESTFLHLRVPKVDTSYIDEGAKLTEKLLSMSETTRPTALLCLDDMVAMGAHQTLIRRGFSIPRDFSITGFNNQDIAKQLYPSLTTIEQHPGLLMKNVGKMLLSQISNNKTKPMVNVISPTLVVRESTGRALETN